MEVRKDWEDSLKVFGIEINQFSRFNNYLGEVKNPPIISPIKRVAMTRVIFKEGSYFTSVFVFSILEVIS